jgi:hypothetical protein
MAAFGATGWFLKGLKHAVTEVNLLTDALVCIPVSAIPDQTADEWISDLSEINSPASRATLTSVVGNEDTTNKEYELDAADATLAAIPDATTFVGYVIAADLGADGASPALFWVDTDNKTGNGGDIIVQFATEGICKLAAV